MRCLILLLLLVCLAGLAGCTTPQPYPLDGTDPEVWRPVDLQYVPTQ